MNLKALIRAEDLHRDLIDIDDKIAETHAILDDLSRNDGQEIEMSILPAAQEYQISAQVDQISADDGHASWAQDFMESQGLNSMILLDGDGKVFRKSKVNKFGVSNKKAIFALDNQEAIKFIEFRLTKLEHQKKLISKSMEEAVAAILTAKTIQ